MTFGDKLAIRILLLGSTHGGIGGVETGHKGHCNTHQRSRERGSCMKQRMTQKNLVLGVYIGDKDKRFVQGSTSGGRVATYGRWV